MRAVGSFFYEKIIITDMVTKQLRLFFRTVELFAYNFKYC